ncbi:MAG: prepilin-type N-terminal cleavage/methylation domain-containing protein [Phycisphaerae bacterium]|nr:prepilin-type N-terminal cleavage/methylation domain-containing protein [Phycisphaerae bacterium]
MTGFTLLEVVIVLMVIGIIAAMAVPMYVSAASVQLRAAADVIASDLEYAKSMAISTGKSHSVVFDTAAESYSIENSDGQVIAHPVHIGADYVVNFANDSRLNRVDIVNTNFGATETVSFDNIGAPFDGSGAALSNGFIQLRAGKYTMRVKIESVTGYVSIE